MKFNAAKHLRHLLSSHRDSCWEPLYNPDGSLLTEIVGRSGAWEETELGELGIDLIKMSPGSLFPLHIHPGHHILYALEGSGSVHINGKNYSIMKGDSIYIAALHPHGVSAKESTSDFHFLAIGIPHKNLSSSERMEFVDGDL